MSASIGAMVLRTVAPEHEVAHAVALAPLVDELWIVEDLPFAGGISQCAAILEATSGLDDPPLIGHGIAPAPFRNPVALAMEWAALARMYPGRIHGGIGHGVPSWMSQIAKTKASPLTLLDETITAVRTLLRGETLDADGRYVNVSDVTLEFAPRDVPLVSAGVTGPRSLEVAGERADGTILPEGQGPEEVERARGHIDDGRNRATPPPNDVHRLTVFTGYFCGDLSTLPPPPAHLPPGWDAVGASPDQVTARLQSLINAGVDSIVLVPFGDDAVGQIELAANDIVPQLVR